MFRTLFAFVLVAVVAGVLSSSSSAAPAAVRIADRARASTWSCQDSLVVKRWRSSGSYRSSPSAAYRSWAARLWLGRRRAACGKVAWLNAEPRRAIAFVFGRVGRASEAERVSSCETGGTFWVGSSNGQYLGLFQMGSWERATFGHGATALEQAFAALRYFVSSGSDWSPWECKP